MLILSRRSGEGIFIDGGITITVLGIHAGVVKLGIDAPKDKSILRDELLRKCEDLVKDREAVRS